MLLAFLLLQAAAATPTPAPVTFDGPKVTFWVSVVALGFLGALGIAILYYVFTQRIDLSTLVSEPTGEASMSRFQLLIFTFVIAASFYLLVVKKGEFPETPNGVLVLLGISASSYLVSKGIQASSPEGLSGSDPHITIHADRPNTSPGGAKIQFTVEATGLTNQAVTWSIDPPTGMGTIDQEKGIYTPPDKANAPAKVTITAVSKEAQSVKDTETIDLVQGS